MTALRFSWQILSKFQDNAIGISLIFRSASRVIIIYLQGVEVNNYSAY
jgi:hypothetical protein